MAAALADALTAHDKVRRSTDIPLFYGRADKDTVTPNQLVERLERAARVANWNTDLRKCDEFYLCLRDRAISWSNTLDNKPGFDKEIWADVKAEFLKAYAPKYTAKTLCTGFQDLKQKSDENVQDFYNRLSDVFRDAYRVKPDHVTTFAGTDAQRLGLTLAEVNAFMKIGIDNMQRLMMNTVFLGGLRDDLRVKVLEQGPDEISASVDLAREIEVILRDKKEKAEKGNYVNSLEEYDDSEGELEVGQDEAKHIDAVNVIRRRIGKPLIRFRVAPGNRPGPGRNAGNAGRRDKKNVKCFYCKLMGHFQLECRKRIAAGAPMVDAAGKPLQNQGNAPFVSSVQNVNNPYYGLLGDASSKNF